MRIITLSLFLVFSVLIFAQDNDSNNVKITAKHSSDAKNTIDTTHSPKKAAIYSAVIPGAGQIYNKQAWKVAFVYGGLGVLSYFIYDNNKIYKDYLQQWKYLTDNDSNTNVRPELSLASADALHNAFSSFRKYRDQCVIGFVLVYAANIIDANVYAHLYNFNVDDISLHFKPEYNIQTRSFTPTARLVLKF